MTPTLHHIRPTIAITMGDANGIGPEIIVRAYEQMALELGPLVVIGSAPVMRKQIAGLGSALKVQVITEAQIADASKVNTDNNFEASCLKVVEPIGFSGIPSEALYPGRVSAQCGLAAYESIVYATQLAMAGKVAALCTAPIHKKAMNLGGVPFSDHTTLLAALTGSTNYAMVLANPHLRTMLVTIHCSVAQALQRITMAENLRIIELAHQTLLAWGIAQPRIAVAGLNPHAGEDGLFGDEEIHLIAPAVAAARAKGIEASGPHPPDTVFMQAMRGAFDIVISQIHDHGLIAVKLNGVEHGVNITAGLPFVRTSPDHGTAYDIAGQGKADPTSMIAALRMARQIIDARPTT